MGTCVCVGTHEGQERVGSPGAGVTGAASWGGHWNWACVLCEKSKYSSALNCFSSSSYANFNVSASTSILLSFLTGAGGSSMLLQSQHAPAVPANKEAGAEECLSPGIQSHSVQYSRIQSLKNKNNNQKMKQNKNNNLNLRKSLIQKTWLNSS